MLQATLIISDESVVVSSTTNDSVTVSIVQGASLWEVEDATHIKPKGSNLVKKEYLELGDLENYDDTAIWSAVNGKVDIVTGKELSDNNYTDIDAGKVDKLIIDGDGTKFLGDDGLYQTVDLSTITSDLANKVDKVTGYALSQNDFTDALETKLNGIEAGANNYTHPANHSPSIITQDASNRFVTDTEKSTWNGKANGTHTHAQADVTDLVTGLAGKQATLVSATNIKTINGSTILGSGDLTVSATLADGDKGDVTVSSSGTVWTVDSSIFLSNTADVLTMDGGLDCNTVTKHWHLGGNAGSNYPVNASGTWFYVETVFYTTTRCRQIAYGYTDNRVYTRQLYGGAWSSWIPIMTANEIGLKNQSTSSQTGFASDTYLTGSYITFPYAPKVGTTYKLIFDVTKTGAGTATPIITIRTGTAGTTSDTSRCVLTYGSGTAVIDSGQFEVVCTFRTVGSSTSAVIQSVSWLTSNLTTTGISNAVKAKQATSSGFDSTTASLGIGASYNGGTSAAHTIQLVRAELIM